MKKTLLAIALFLSAITGAFAQIEDPVTKLSVGFSAGANVGPYSSAYPTAAGLILKGEFPLSESPISLMVTTGLTFFVSKDGYSAGTYYGSYGSDSYSTGSVACFFPVQIGARAYVAGRFFVQGDVGASFNINSTTADFTSKKVALLLSPALGYNFAFGDSEKFGMDLGLGYENRIEPGGGYGQIALKVTFNLGFGAQ